MSDIFTLISESNHDMTPPMQKTAHVTPPHASQEQKKTPPHAENEQKKTPPMAENDPPMGVMGGVKNCQGGGLFEAKTVMGGVVFEGVSPMGGGVFDANPKEGGVICHTNSCLGGRKDYLQIPSEAWIRVPDDEIETEFRRIYDKLIMDARIRNGAKVSTSGWGQHAQTEISGGFVSDEDWKVIDAQMASRMRSRLIELVRVGNQAAAASLRLKLVAWSHVQPDFDAMIAKLNDLIDRYAKGLAKIGAGEFQTEEALDKAERWLTKYRGEAQAIVNEVGLVRPWLLKGLTLPWA